MMKILGKFLDKKQEIKPGQLVSYDGEQYKVKFIEGNELVCTKKSFDTPRYRLKPTAVRIVE